MLLMGKEGVASRREATPRPQFPPGGDTFFLADTYMGRHHLGLASRQEATPLK